MINARISRFISFLTKCTSEYYTMLIYMSIHDYSGAYVALLSYI